MKSEQDRVIEIMQQMNQGNAAGRRLQYSPDLRRIVPVEDSGNPANTDPDHAMVVTPKDLEHFCVVAPPQCLIVLQGVSVQSALETGETAQLRFCRLDGDTVFSALGVDGAHCSVSGTVEPVSSLNLAAPGLMDEWSGCVHVILVHGRDDRSRVQTDESPLMYGFVRRNDHWEDAGVIVTPVQEELFSRTKGIIETGILADRHVAVFGLGSGGSYIVWELAKQGIMHFALMDHDRLEVGNVVRHMAGLSDVGRLKTNVLKEMVLNKNPYAEVRT